MYPLLLLIILIISASIYSPEESGIGEGQFMQSTTNNSSCTYLTFNVFCRCANEELILFAGGRCTDATLSQRRIQTKNLILPCTYPIGFQHKVQAETKCICECDSKLTISGYMSKNASLKHKLSYDKVNLGSRILSKQMQCLPISVTT
jgi:hypothetical protein